jgi:long-chain acyl-CoA synthetase
MTSESVPLADFSSAAAKRDRHFAAIPNYRTLPEIVAANRALHGEYPALFFDGRFHTNTGLFANALRLAAVLRGIGVRTGDRIVVNLPNCQEIWLCYLACSSLGAVIVPTVPALTIDELNFVISDAEPAAIVTVREKADQLKKSLATSESVKTVLAGGRAEAELMSLIQGAAPLEASFAVGPDDLASIIYTSGTTGKPKGVMLTQRSLCRQACLNYAFYIGPGEDSRAATLLMPLPMCHIFGLAVALASLLMGNLMVVMERFDPAEALALIKSHRVRIVPAVPTMLVRLLAAEGAAFACGSVRQWDCGGSALAPELLERVEQELGGLVTEGWGLSETSSAVTQNVPSVPRKRGSVGLALPGLELAVRSPDGQPCGAGEPGELLVRGETVMRSYWKRPEVTANAFTSDGFLRTGDIGCVDSDGYCFIVGRKDDLIIRGGQNISPRELEETILEHPAVREVAVVGMPDPEFGQVAAAFIVAKDGMRLDDGEIIAFCRKRLARHKIPARVLVIDQLPRNSTGKVIKGELRRRYAG